MCTCKHPIVPTLFSPKVSQTSIYPHHSIHLPSNFFVFLLFKIPIVEWSRRASVFYSSPNTQEGRECGFPKWWCHKLPQYIFVVLHFTVLLGLCSASHLREWCRSASHLPTATLPIIRRSSLAIALFGSIIIIIVVIIVVMNIATATTLLTTYSHIPNN